MKRLWKQKWLVLAATVAIFLSVGAVAWAATDLYGVVDPDTTVGETAGDTDAQGPGTGVREALRNARAEIKKAVREAGAEVRQAVKEAREHWLERRGEKTEALRGEMTAEDQALYDELIQKIEDERATVQKARERLKTTLGELRELLEKYRGDQD